MLLPCFAAQKPNLQSSTVGSFRIESTSSFTSSFNVKKGLQPVTFTYEHLPLAEKLWPALPFPLNTAATVEAFSCWYGGYGGVDLARDLQEPLPLLREREREREGGEASTKALHSLLPHLFPSLLLGEGLQLPGKGHLHRRDS